MSEHSLISIYGNRRMAALIGLGFASGLPFTLTRDSLQVWMRNVGIDLAVITLFSLVGIPYAIKFVWAPVMDRFVPRIGRGRLRLGRRRSWLLITQLALVVAIAGLALAGPTVAEQSLDLLAISALAVAFLSASQDIVADAYRTDVLPREELGAGAAVFVTGYRMAMVASGAGALVLSDHLSWPVVYLLMAGGMIIGIAATLLAPEPSDPLTAPASLAEAVIEPLARFITRRGGWLILLFVILFKLPDTLAQTITTPFLLDSGFTNSEIGYIRQGLGLAITILGALIGGAIVSRFTLIQSLLLFGMLQAISNAGFWLLAVSEPTRPLLIVVIAVENFCTGLVIAGFVAFLMHCCERRYSATQYALLSSLMTLAASVGGAPTGSLVNAIDYPAFFSLSILAGAPGLLMLPWLRAAVETDTGATR